VKRKLNGYQSFLNDKLQEHTDLGFDPLWIPDFLFGFEAFLTEWSIRKGRAGIFADCGMGKSIMELVWGENVLRYINKPVLIATPLAVSYQFVKEGEKFGIEVERSSNGKHKKGIVVTNYERLHYFNPDDFGGFVGDESSILKNFDGATKALVTEFVRKIPYRLLGTATAAPNDFQELGTSSEALGYLGYKDMLTRFFKQETAKDYLGWGRLKYRFRGHAEHPFWRWVCSWARSCRRPSDLGFDDDGFILPKLVEREVLVETDYVLPGKLMLMPSTDLNEQRAERRATIKERCEKVAEIVSLDDTPSVSWCHLNPEGDYLEKVVPEARQVHGRMQDEEKEELLLAFQQGQLKRLIIKPKIACFGLNWQHCHRITMFPSHSYEQAYQAIRRCWRFGQKEEVILDVIASPGEAGVIQNLQRKSKQVDRMFDSIVKYMNEELVIDRSVEFKEKVKVPSWL
jgi:hypothetical protein